MERPKIKDYFAEKADIKTVHNEYRNSPHLHSYSSALDRYVDWLEDKYHLQGCNMLPSESEIQKYIDDQPYYGTCTPEYKEGIEQGIKWVLDRLKVANNDR